MANGIAAQDIHIFGNDIIATPTSGLEPIVLQVPYILLEGIIIILTQLWTFESYNNTFLSFKICQPAQSAKNVIRVTVLKKNKNLIRQIH